MLPSRTATLALLAVGLAVVFGLMATTAQADTTPILAGAPAPWSDPSHQTPLEQLAGSIASTLVGRPVTVHCEDAATWTALGTSPGESGFVRGTSYDLDSNLFVESATTIELSPDACLALQAFVQAPVKPTKCAATTQVKRTVTRSHYVWRTRIVHGKKERVRVKVPYTVTVKHSVVASLAPCFLGTPVSQPSFDPSLCQGDLCYVVTANEPQSFWDAYDTSAQAILALAHEAVHVEQDTMGAPVPAASLVEAQAECSGMQTMASVAVALGDTPDDAQALAAYSYDIDYPGKAASADPYSLAHPYWSAECKPGGALDIRATASALWP